MTEKIFVIGFNRCGTTSIRVLLERNGIRCLQRQADDADTILGAAVAVNFSAGRPLLAGLNRFQAFMDFGLAEPGFVFEGCRMFWQLHAEHPDAYFILNMRPLEHWIDSRALYLEGAFLANYGSALGYNEAKTQQVWRKQYLAHVEDVREHFSENPGNYLEFDIENDNPEVLRDFLSGHYTIDLRHWGWWNETPDDVPLSEPLDDAV